MMGGAADAKELPKGALHPAFSAAAAVAVAAAVYWGFQPERAGGPTMWLALLACYAPLSVGAGVLLQRAGRLRALLRYRAGDPSLGVAVAALLLAGSWALIVVFIPPGDPNRAWLYGVLLLGTGLKHAWGLGALLVVVCCEELVWRGFVPAALEGVGGAHAWGLAIALFAVAHVPALFALADTSRGLNPLVLVAALGGGLAWGLLASRTGRIAPSIFCHWVVSYFAVVLFRFALVR